MKITRFAAIRKDRFSGKEWVDTKTISCTPELARIRAIDINSKTGITWYKDNSIIKITEVEITF